MPKGKQGNSSNTYGPFTVYTADVTTDASVTTNMSMVLNTPPGPMTVRVYDGEDNETVVLDALNKHACGTLVTLSTDNGYELVVTVGDINNVVTVGDIHNSNNDSTQ